MVPPSITYEIAEMWVLERIENEMWTHYEGKVMNNQTFQEMSLTNFVVSSQSNQILYSFSILFTPIFLPKIPCTKCCVETNNKIDITTGFSKLVVVSLRLELRT